MVASTMMTLEELITEINMMKKEAGIKEGRISMFYGPSEIIPVLKRQEIEDQTGLSFTSSAVGRSRFGRFLVVEGRTKGDRKITIHCTESFYEKIA